MLKFVKQHMESIQGIEIYPLISFMIFFLFFVGMLIYVFKADKARMSSLGALPLDLETPKQKDNYEKA
jgi:cytochrome c oxidase cbb3-type subunit 4